MFSVAGMRKKPVPKGKLDVLSIEAAKILGVCEITLRRWIGAASSASHRHPVNGYRCYRRDDMWKPNKQIATGKAA